MKNISISTFVHIIFSITFMATVFLFQFFIKSDQQAFLLNQQNNFNLIANSFSVKFKQQADKKDIETLAKTLNLSIVDKRDINIKILNRGKIIYSKENFDLRVRVFSYLQKNYIYIQSIGYNLMFNIDIKKNSNFSIAITIFFFILLLIIFLYISLQNKLKPLTLLNKKIQQFSKGDLSVQLSIDSKDEIGQIANSFNTAINNINQLVHSKNLFMKNIIHELKTPITKGIFLATMIETKQEEDKELLIKNFKTLNSIINQLSNIEKLKTNHLQIKKENIDIEGTVNQIRVMLDKSAGSVKLIQNNDESIIANKDLFGTMLKNLIENGFKYSKKEPIIVIVEDKKVCVKSYGKKLKKPLSHYTQAFVQDKKNSEGFGLGLYIVNEIAKIHSFKLEYAYEDEYNKFTLNLS